MRNMTRPEAVAVLIDVCKRERQPNVREFRQLVRALGRLGLDAGEMRQAARLLDICRNDGRPWSADLAAQIPWAVDDRPAAR